MVIFHSYVKLPEGNSVYMWNHVQPHFFALWYHYSHENLEVKPPKIADYTIVKTPSA